METEAGLVQGPGPAASGEVRRVGIVGGSLGGLAAAYFLSAAGFEVDVFERSPTPLAGLGAGIVLNPATVRFLGPGHKGLESLSVKANVVQYLGHEGSIIAERLDAYRFSSFDRLYVALSERIPGERYHLGAPVLDFMETDEEVTLLLADGTQHRFDIVVFADGIGSAARTRLLPDVTATYAGYVAWRGNVPLSSLEPWVIARFNHAVTYHVRKHSHLLVYPIPSASGPSSLVNSFNWLWYVNTPEGPELDGLLTDQDGVRRHASVRPGTVPTETVERLRRSARELPEALRRLIDATQHPFLQAVFDAEVPRMVFGRSCLIGDAAFVIRPHAAAGAAKAVEDSFQLSRALFESRGDLHAALGQWEERQLELGLRVLRASRVAGDAFQHNGTARPGERLAFGLREMGDSLLSPEGWA